MPLTDAERANQVAEWDAEIAQTKRDIARYEALGETEKAAEAATRIETFRKLRAELLGVPSK
jgi:hypothetical protein